MSWVYFDRLLVITDGGAFRFEGGNSDQSNPVRLTFDRVIFDHNSASSGGAVMINGRAGHGLPDSSAQNWDSGVAATWDDCVFFRNFAAHYDAAILVANVWCERNRVFSSLISGRVW